MKILIINYIPISKQFKGGPTYLGNRIILAVIGAPSDQPDSAVERNPFAVIKVNNTEEMLCINRKTESEILKLASKFGACPEVFFTNEKFSAMRFVEAQHFDQSMQRKDFVAAVSVKAIGQFDRLMKSIWSNNKK